MTEEDRSQEFRFKTIEKVKNLLIKETDENE